MINHKASIIKAGALLAILLSIMSVSVTATMDTAATDDSSKSYIDHRASSMDPDRLYLMAGPEGNMKITETITVTVINTKGDAVTGLSSEAFVFTILSTARSSANTKLFTIQAGPKSTNDKGQMTFSISTKRAISGTFVVKVSVDGIMLDDQIIVTCRTADYNANGVVDLPDFIMFTIYYAVGNLHADLNFDGRVSQFDFLAFSEEFNHR